MSDFASALTRRKFVVSSPFVFATKGEMCRNPAISRVGDYLRLTFSCDGYPVQKKNKPQCGTCTSCLLRRVSFHAADLMSLDPATSYVADLLTDKASERQLRFLRVMEWQYEKLNRLVKSPSPWVNLTSEFPHLKNICAELCVRDRLNESEIQQSIVTLYSRYLQEWKSFPVRQLLVRKRAA